MIVYGDSSLKEPVGALASRLRCAASKACTLDEVRSVLVQAGQLEQALEDELPEWASEARRETDLAASALLGLGPASAVGEVLSGLSRIGQAVSVKVPEGFAFYALFPEAYAESARRWLASEPSARRISVIGVRSIGTTLSAVVAASLRAQGRKVDRFTVRPQGHPFDRKVEIDPARLASSDWVIVVDEGPGLSGSSMAAVAQAAEQAVKDRVVFFPGHGNGPGPQASPDVQRRWRETRCVVTPNHEVLSVADVLSRQAGEEVVAVEDLSGGNWRRWAYSDESQWPAVATAFERPMVGVRLKGGGVVAWTFVGFDRPGTTLGYLPAQWPDGERLTLQDSPPDLAKCIESSAGPPMTREELDAARTRLDQMLRCNVQEAFSNTLSRSLTRFIRCSEGEEHLPPRLKTLHPKTPTGRHMQSEGRSPGARTVEEERSPEGATSQSDTAKTNLPGRRFGDGDLAPHHWVRSQNGEIHKIKPADPWRDHTIVGVQPFAWDIVGAIVEWSLSYEQADALAKRLNIDEADLRFHRLAYAAFRMGLFQVSADATADPIDRARQIDAWDRYRDILAQEL